MFRRWLAVCLIPAATVAFFLCFPSLPGSSDYLADGIVLACECVFLFKYVLLVCIVHHLRGEGRQKRQAAWLFLPPVLFALYICHYFGVF
ncbi:MAG: hypothetical protein Q3966_01270 [Neisseria sp.]|nr:hypothetical protein [Neisseria sp.]